MSEMLPLFPLSTVLFPGMRLPLHIFEDRYRALVSDLLASPEPRRFGVIAIRSGREIGADGSLTGYGSGLHRKRWLLEHEGVRLQALNRYRPSAKA